ncbi:hypothetical protein EPUL_003240 [Erysiphe pulchra]|uniref:Impact N-terminal domain-containing protein n=1 Tax=Erysiphe pulchra TaxID=225359 RepID=A0A2S4PWI3_9PEZI|nr:hypothetical protein EPUL_003240 [Erysiphe pulchra]
MQRDHVNEGEEEEEENETLKDEITAINSIYGEDTIRPMIIENDNIEKNIYILHLPHQEIWLKIQFAPRYPYCSNDDDEQQQQKEDKNNRNYENSAPSLTALPPIRVLGTHGFGPMLRKGDGTRICQVFEKLVRQLYRPGDVYLFDIMEELMNYNEGKCKNNDNNKYNNITPLLSYAEKELLPNIPTEKSSSSDLLCEENINSSITPSSSTAITATAVRKVNYKNGKYKSRREDNYFSIQQQLLQTPKWFVSEPIRELKSLFLAHCTYIHSINDVARFRNLLLEQEDKKKLTSATHNIMAWRIRYLNENHNNDKKDNDDLTFHHRPDNKPKKKKIPPNQSPIEEDYDDDGESAAGARLLHLMRLMDTLDVLVIVSRWYGGVNLGPRRFALINSVARDAILKANTNSNSDL